jgi:hypothetical protein
MQGDGLSIHLTTLGQIVTISRGLCRDETYLGKLLVGRWAWQVKWHDLLQICLDSWTMTIIVLADFEQLWRGLNHFSFTKS